MPPSYTGHTFAKFLITIVSGLLTGIFAVGLSKVVHIMFDWKNGYIQSLLDEPGGAGRVWIAFLWHCAYSCCLVSFGVALVRSVTGAQHGASAATAARCHGASALQRASTHGPCMPCV